MKETLEELARRIDLNLSESYLHLELNTSGYKLWIVEIGTGGCTFPAMEILIEGKENNEAELQKTLNNKHIIAQILKAKEKLKKENPYFYDTVFK